MLAMSANRKSLPRRKKVLIPDALTGTTWDHEQHMCSESSSDVECVFFVQGPHRKYETGPGVSEPWCFGGLAASFDMDMIWAEIEPLL